MKYNHGVIANDVKNVNSLNFLSNYVKMSSIQVLNDDLEERNLKKIHILGV